MFGLTEPIAELRRLLAEENRRLAWDILPALLDRIKELEAENANLQLSLADAFRPGKVTDATARGIAAAATAALDRLRADHANHFADTRRIVAWRNEDPIRSPSVAFTAGPERLIADLIFSLIARKDRP